MFFHCIVDPSISLIGIKGYTPQRISKNGEIYIAVVLYEFPIATDSKRCAESQDKWNFEFPQRCAGVPECLFKQGQFNRPEQMFVRIFFTQDI